MGTWDWDVPGAAIWWDEQMHALFGLAPGAFRGSFEDFLGLIQEEDRESKNPADLIGKSDRDLFPDAKYETSRRRLSPRDVLLLFTDGLFEVEGSAGQLYDYERLLKAVGDRTVLPVAELCRSLVAEVQQFSATQEFNDDVCLLAMDIDRLKPL